MYDSRAIKAAKVMLYDFQVVSHDNNYTIKDEYF